jgi:hypothetical protein
MQEKFSSLTSKKVVTGKKGKKVQLSAGGGAAKAGDKYGNGVAKKGEDEGGEEENEDEEWAQKELELMELRTIQEATAAKLVVVPDGKSRGLRFSGGEQYDEVNLRRLKALVKKDLWSMGGLEHGRTRRSDPAEPYRDAAG